MQLSIDDDALQNSHFIEGGTRDDLFTLDVLTLDMLFGITRYPVIADPLDLLNGKTERCTD
jgi:hypothetical protein